MKGAPFYRLAVSADEVVEHNRLVSVFGQILAHVGADITGSANHQNMFHLFIKSNITTATAIERVAKTII